MIAPRLLLDSELDISTQRSTGGSLWTDCAPLRGMEVAVAEAERESDVDRLFVGSAELEGVAFGVGLVAGLSLALLWGVAVVATLLADLDGVALAFGVALAADCLAADCWPASAVASPSWSASASVTSWGTETR